MQYFPYPSLIRLILVIFFIPIVAKTMLSQEKPLQQTLQSTMNIAVMDFFARGGISDNDASTLTDIFQNRLLQTKDITLVDRSKVKSVLQEQTVKHTEGCFQLECMIEAGKILNVDKIFIGTISNIGNNYSVNIQLVDVQTGQVISSKDRSNKGEYDYVVSHLIPAIADEMADELTGNKESAQKGSSSWLWYVVGGVAVAGGVAAAVLLKSNEGTNQPVVPPAAESLPQSPSFP